VSESTSSSQMPPTATINPTQSGSPTPRQSGAETLEAGPYLQNIADKELEIKKQSGTLLVATVFAIAGGIGLLVTTNQLIVGALWIVTTFFGLGILGVLLRISTLKGEQARDQKLLDTWLSLARALQSGESIGSAAPGSAVARDADYFERLVRINVTNLGEYYYLVKTHTGRSFSVALVSAVAGFAVIGTAVGLAFYRNEASNFEYAVVVAGLLTEFISGVMFWLYSRTVRQLKGYHDSLLNFQNVLLGLKMIEDVQDDSHRAQLLTIMLGILVRPGGQPPPQT
jgi:hypothetical protein